MRIPFSDMHTTIRLTVVTVVIIATSLTAGLAIGLQYYFGQHMARNAAANLYATASSGIASELRSVARVNANVIDLLADNPTLRSIELQNAHLKSFVRVLEKNPLYYGIYLGSGDGGFFEVINFATSAKARRELQAQPEDRWLIITIEQSDNGHERHFRYLDENLNTRLTRSEPTGYNVTSRPWYTNAIASDQVQVTPPYLFAQLGKPGRTLSKRIPGSNTVIAIDMTLASISRFLKSHSISEHGDVFIFDAAGQVIASSIDHKQQNLDAQTTELIAGEQAFIAPGAATTEHLSRIAADPNLHGRLEKARINGHTYLAYIEKLGETGSPLYMGILTSRADLVAPFLEKVKWSISITAAFLLLLLPLSWLFANPIVRPIRQLALENDKVQRREYDQVNRVASHVKELDDLSDSMVKMVASIQAHELAQRRLMDSFIELIAAAIDDKSAYTGGHCERVPELALMLAEQASRSEQTAFKDFHLDTDDQWREYRIAAWLHDCGKITTPEHIVDKGTKLETIYNRIHEVRMRFEVLWRDAELAYWKQISESADKRTELAEQLAKTQQELLDDFTFVAECNVGGEFLGPEKLERLENIGKTIWQRHFDDRIGLSPVEELRLLGEPASLPAKERLLSDKPEHIIQRTQSTSYPPELGINMDIPSHLYNLGEIYNLSISRGTLTDEDRFRINEHMISTIKMLESLPFPEELKNVPRYASTHHETMKGTGYPRKLPGSQLSIPERLLAIADIFEALTASDRPYKKAKPVSVAIDIMHKMVLDGHIDADCFELFVKEKVYMQYAHQYLKREQTDEVDIHSYFS